MNWAFLIAFIIIEIVILWACECEDLFEGILVTVVSILFIGGPLVLLYVDVVKNHGAITLLMLKVMAVLGTIAGGVTTLTWLEKRGGK